MWRDKRCPFCGQRYSYDIRKRVGVSHPWYQVLCDNCGASGPREATEMDAVAAWNTREQNVEQEAERE